MQPITPASEGVPQAIPPPLRKHHFDRAAPFIGEALRQFPGVVIFYPQTVTPETLARCVRQGITAKLIYGYTHPELDDELFAKHHRELSIAVRYKIGYPAPPPAVIVGGRAEVKAYVL